MISSSRALGIPVTAVSSFLPIISVPCLCTFNKTLPTPAINISSPSHGKHPWSRRLLVGLVQGHNFIRECNLPSIYIWNAPSGVAFRRIDYVSPMSQRTARRVDIHTSNYALTLATTDLVTFTTPKAAPPIRPPQKLQERQASALLDIASPSIKLALQPG